MAAKKKYPATPDGRYFMVRGRLWRTSNPKLSEAVRQGLVNDLMHARRDVGIAKRAGDKEAERAARRRVDVAKHGLGERGEPWWTDGAPDYNRHLAKNTPYAGWAAEASALTPARSSRRKSETGSHAEE